VAPEEIDVHQAVALDDERTATVPPVTNRLADTSRVARDAAAEARRGRPGAALRAPVRSIDVLLDELERVNLAGGATTATSAVVDWLARLEDAVGARAPEWVREVPDTARLHAAILRWQGELLDRCRPDRRGIGDMHDEPLDAVLPPPRAAAALRHLRVA